MVELDAGVFRVDRRDGPSWVARVFPAERALADVEAEAELLRALEQGGFPAERCAHGEPVSGWGEQAVLVTEFVTPAAPLTPGRSAALLGAMLGGLHSRPGTRFRSGGAWHHLSFTGGPREEIAAGRELLDDAVAEVPARQLAAFDRLREAVEQADDCDDLPHALVHPDFVAVNAIPTPEERLVIVDWTGAGRGPAADARLLVVLPRPPAARRDRRAHRREPAAGEQDRRPGAPGVRGELAGVMRHP